jgi:hypothetical protein
MKSGLRVLRAGSGGPLLPRMIVSETAGLEDYGAQPGAAVATSVVEMHKRNAGPGHRILKERDRRCRRQAMLAAQMQESAHKPVAAVSVIITVARPVAVVGKKLEHEIASGIGLIAPDGDELSVSPAAVRTAARSLQIDPLDQTRIVPAGGEIRPASGAGSVAPA